MLENRIMEKLSFNILRIGLAITFLWIGVLILVNPEAWLGYLRPWAVGLLPISDMRILMVTGILDILIGILLLLNYFILPVTVIGSLHIIIILIVSGITDITVRDIGILAGVMALAIDVWSKKI